MQRGPSAGINEALIPAEALRPITPGNRVLTLWAPSLYVRAKI